MRLGIATYLIPFFFVLSPALVLQGDDFFLPVLLEVIVGTWLIAGAAQGYLTLFGRLEFSLSALAIGFSGVLIALPDLALLGFSGSNWILNGVGIIAVALALIVEVLSRRAKIREVPANLQQ
jgi:TRAP-type uncharacterized transport system fused permease subunit